MNLLKVWHSRKFFISAAFLYVLFFALFVIGQRSKVPDLPIVVMQMLGMIMIVFFSFLYDRQSISKTILLIVLFQLICCYGLRFFRYYAFFFRDGKWGWLGCRLFALFLWHTSKETELKKYIRNENKNFTIGSIGTRNRIAGSADFERSRPNHSDHIAGYWTCMREHWIFCK